MGSSLGGRHGTARHGTLPAGHICGEADVGQPEQGLASSQACPARKRPASEQSKPQACQSAMDIQGLGSDGDVSQKAAVDSSGSTFHPVNQLALVTYHRDKHGGNPSPHSAFGNLEPSSAGQRWGERNCYTLPV